LLAHHGRWFSPGTQASSITKTGRHDVAKILLKHQKSNQIKSNLTKLDLYIVIPNKTKKSNNIKYMHTSLSNLGSLRSIIVDDKKLLTQLDRYKETKYIIESRKRFSSTEFVSKTFRTFD
jgi:transposase